LAWIDQFETRLKDALLIQCESLNPQQPDPDSKPKRFWVGFSGGLDSTVLLWLCSEWCRRFPDWEPAAIHINHQISPQAANWAEHCQQVCADLGVPCVVEAVKVLADGGDGLENAARRARYEAFTRCCQGEPLMLAHHLDDQAETLLLRLLRGSGLRGLSGMRLVARQSELTVIRPLLEVSREELQRLALSRRWSWIEDESNSNTRFDRNFLRLEVVPLLQSRWPQAARSLAQAARWIGEGQDVLDALIAEEVAGHIQEDGSLNLQAWKPLAPERQRLWLRCWLSRFSVYPPGKSVLDELISSVICARPDARSQLEWAGMILCRYRGRIYARLPDPVLPVDWFCVDNGLPQQAMQALRGRVIWRQAVAGLSDKWRAQGLEWRLRHGGELCRPAGRLQRPLKKWLQDAALPPWHRAAWPLLYMKDQLIAVPGLFVCEGFQAPPGEMGWFPDWLPDPPGS
jgi:tRNA(Ile)-lysidine synthase